MIARFKLTKGSRVATFAFSWPVGGNSWDGTGSLVFESGSRTALEEMTELASRLEARPDPHIVAAPFPDIRPPYLRKIDGVYELAFGTGWEWSWIGKRPADLEDRYEKVPPGAVS